MDTGKCFGSTTVSRSILRSACCIAVMLVSGCTAITIQRLDPTLTTPAGAEGLIYYLPQPYLLVAELPPTTVDSSTGAAQQQSEKKQNDPKDTLPPPAAPPGETVQAQDSGKVAKKGDATAKDGKATKDSKAAKDGKAAKTSDSPGAGDNEKKFSGPGASDTTKNAQNADNSSQANGAQSAAPTSDTSFAATTPQYAIRLIYLPDRTRPISMKAGNGWFGNSDLKPTLQDGWMLTALDASSNTGVADTLTALGSIVGGVMGGGSSKAATKAAGSAPGAGAESKAAKQPADLHGFFTADHFILRPGLYRLDYGDDGVLLAVRAVSYFTGCGAISPAAAVALAQAKSAATGSATQPTCPPVESSIPAAAPKSSGK